MATDCIPEWARGSYCCQSHENPRLEVRAGAHILSHGREENPRLPGMLCVVAADACALEILPKIDFPAEGSAERTVGRIRKQLVHMLAVALDMEIASGAVTDLGWQRENLLEILIGLFARKLADVVRQGVPRRYIGHEEDLPALRGPTDRCDPAVCYSGQPIPAEAGLSLTMHCLLISPLKPDHEGGCFSVDPCLTIKREPKALT